jgi:Right handed beta helix region
MRLLAPLSFALAILTVSSAAFSATYYVVATGGDDTASGAMGSPWATLQHAADSVAAGDTVMVAAGSYVGFDIQTSGAPNAPITFSADAGTMVTTQNPDTPDGINIENCSYVVVQGFTVNNMPRTGIRTAVGDHITIRKNKCDANQVWGILTGHVDDLLIEENETSNSVQQHGIYVGNSGDRPVIRHNIVWGNAGNGIHMNGDISQGGDGVISNALVERNVIYSNGLAGGSGINCDGIQDSVFQNNLIYDEHASGISLYVGDGAAPSTNNLVINNTVIIAADGRWALNIKNASTGNKAFNNIFLNLGTYHGSEAVLADSLTGFVSDYNVVMDRFTIDDGDSVQTLAAWTQAQNQDTHSFIGDGATLFASVATNDYHLAMTSPAIDKGTPGMAPNNDLDGNARPIGNGFDIGAYEYCDSNCMPVTTTSSSTSSATAATSGAGPNGATSTGAGSASSGGAGGGGSGSASSGGCGCRTVGHDEGPTPAYPIAFLSMVALVRIVRRRNVRT